MIPAAFAYERPTSLGEALELLDRYGGSAKVLAGGQSLLPLLKLRLARVERLVDIRRLGELKGIRDHDGGLALGALTTYRELLESDLVRSRYPLIVEATEDIADLQVRNVGTVGGAVAHCDPASDLPAVLLALEASVVLRSRAGDRVLPLDAFLQGPFTTACAPNEILTEIRLPAPPAGAGTAYRHLEQPASGYSIVGVAAVVARAGADSGFGHVRVALTGVGERPYRATAVEAALAGTDWTPEQLAAAASRATEGVTVNSDIHADAAYRAHLAGVLTRRALEAAKARSA
ncbi:MAG TPA: xanthine dehydrogenase family protein subunit M [Candidatus Binatia bacterium]|nr:xanthine dehydrogenase family protein subunit M [Candidatus Binatia bacterium]